MRFIQVFCFLNKSEDEINDRINDWLDEANIEVASDGKKIEVEEISTAVTADDTFYLTLRWSYYERD